MSKYKQDISKFVKGLENKLTDKVVRASDATIEQNGRKDGKCKGLERRASSKCCFYCMSHEGTYSFASVDSGAMGGKHEACKCKVTPIFKKQTKEQRVASRDADILLEKARKHEKQTTQMLKSLENESMKLEGLDYRLKSKSSLERKFLSDALKMDCLPKEAYKGINDVLRYTYVVDEKQFYNCFAEIRSALEEKGYNFIKVKNSLKSKGVMYRGVNTVVEMPDGYLFELQFHTSDSLKFKEIVHKLYEEYRQLKSTSKRAKILEKQMIEISNQVATPTGSDMVKL